MAHTRISVLSNIPATPFLLVLGAQRAFSLPHILPCSGERTSLASLLEFPLGRGWTRSSHPLLWSIMPTQLESKGRQKNILPAFSCTGRASISYIMYSVYKGGKYIILAWHGVT